MLFCCHVKHRTFDCPLKGNLPMGKRFSEGDGTIASFLPSLPVPVEEAAHFLGPKLDLLNCHLQSTSLRIWVLNKYSWWFSYTPNCSGKYIGVFLCVDHPAGKVVVWHHEAPREERALEAGLGFLIKENLLFISHVRPASYYSNQIKFGVSLIWFLDLAL